ncbi:unnamed protein product [Diplocarpon coronariae]
MGLARSLTLFTRLGTCPRPDQMEGGWPRPELGSRRPVAAVGETAAREGRLKIARENRERGCGGRNGASGAQQPTNMDRARSRNTSTSHAEAEPRTRFPSRAKTHSCSGTEGERGLPVTSTWPRHGTATAASPATPQSHESEREGESDEAAHLHDPLSPGFGPAARRHVGTWGMYSPCPAASPLRARRRNGPGARGITRGGDAVRRETLASASPGSCVASSWAARPRPQGFLCVGVPDLP